MSASFQDRAFAASAVEPSFTVSPVPASIPCAYRPYKPERHAMFLELRSEGKTRAQIAAALNLSPATIKSRLEYLRARGVL